MKLLFALLVISMLLILPGCGEKQATTDKQTQQKIFDCGSADEIINDDESGKKLDQNQMNVITCLSGRPDTCSSAKTQLDENQVKVLTCLSDRIDSCSPAKAMFGSYAYDIAGKKDGLCMISGPSVDYTDPSGKGLKTVSCGFGKDVLPAVESMEVAIKRGENFGADFILKTGEKPTRYSKAFVAISIMTFGGTDEIALPNGAKKSVTCS